MRVQVLDDSTDQKTRDLVDDKCLEWQERGVKCECVRRTNRHGYKAGALKDVCPCTYQFHDGHPCPDALWEDNDAQQACCMLWSVMLYVARPFPIKARPYLGASALKTFSWHVFLNRRLLDKTSHVYCYPGNHSMTDQRRLCQ